MLELSTKHGTCIVQGRVLDHSLTQSASISSPGKALIKDMTGLHNIHILADEKYVESITNCSGYCNPSHIGMPSEMNNVSEMLRAPTSSKC